MERLLSVLALVSAVMVVIILRSVRREHIRVEYSVSWLGFALSLFALSQSEWLRHWLGGLLGIDDPRLVVLNVIIGISLIVIYRFSLVISALKDSNIALTQRLAILEFRLQSNDEEK